MKILILSIKQTFFDQILSGEKTEEFREVRPSNATKYIVYRDDSGEVYTNANNIPEDVEVDAEPIQYDAIKFLTGEYKGTRPSMIVRVEKSELQLLEDEDGELIAYQENGEEYVAAQMCYSLGEIIEKPSK